jgi:hypothetical protein
VADPRSTTVAVPARRTRDRETTPRQRRKVRIARMARRLRRGRRTRSLTEKQPRRETDHGKSRVVVRPRSTAPRGRAGRGIGRDASRGSSIPTARAPTRPNDARLGFCERVRRPRRAGEAARSPRSSRVAVRPEIDDGAALARGTWDPARLGSRWHEWPSVTETVYSPSTFRSRSASPSAIHWKPRSLG